MIENKARTSNAPKLPAPPYPTSSSPILGPEVLIIDNALTGDDCAILAGHAGHTHQGAHLDPDRSDSDLAGILANVDRLFKDVATEHYHVNPETGEYVVLKYRPGDYMGSHRDNEYEGAIIAGHLVPRVPVACCFYLTPPEAYAGGALVINDRRMRPNQGTAVFVRGDTEHRVDAVIRGHRVILKVIGTGPTNRRWRFSSYTETWSRCDDERSAT